MKLAFKLMAVLMLAVIALMSVFVYLTLQDELRAFETEKLREATLLGNVLARHITEIWERNGFERAQKLIEDANKAESPIQIRWVWFDAPESDPFGPRVDRRRIASLRSGQEVRTRVPDSQGNESLLTYVPVFVTDDRPGALELAQSLAPMDQHTRTIVFRNLSLVGAMMAVCGALVFLLGTSMVGRPIQSLVSQARRIAEGDLTGEVGVHHGGDEIAELANDLNRMFAQLRQAQMQLNDETSRRITALEQLHHAQRLATVGKIASGLAHELGTPLNVVSGRAKMIATQNLTASEIVTYAQIIRDQTDRMTGIVRELLGFSRRQTSRKTLLDPMRCIHQVLDVLQVLARQRRVLLHASGEDPGLRVRADGTRIQQALTNLVMNAIQATPDGGTVEVALSREHVLPPAGHGGPEADYLCVKVKDQGEGIPQENLDRIFEPFFTTRSSDEGTGLGLSIANDAVRQNGGWLVAESTPGKGSCFSMYLPMEAEAWKAES